MTDTTLQQLADAMRSHHLKLATAESCTGGWIAKTVTDLAGSSEWFDLGIVSYSNEAKINILGVDPDTIEQHGAVSRQTVLEMVCGLLDRSSADIVVAVSGVAGPGGGTPDKPVGTVWFAWCCRGHPAAADKLWFEGDRDYVRQKAVEFALQVCLAMVHDE